MAYIGAKIKEDTVVKVEKSLKEWLPSNEFIVAIFYASRIKPLTDAVVITNMRLMSVYLSGLKWGKGFPLEITAEEIKDTFLKGNNLFIELRDGTKKKVGSIPKEDHQIILKALKRMSGNPTKLDINEREQEKNRQEKVEAKLQRQSAKEARVRREPGSDRSGKCPRCGSSNLQAIQETKTRGVDAVSSTAGCCCLGPIGLLCGLPGAGQSSTKTMRMCLNCGKKF
jgi:hypothetical protein